MARADDELLDWALIEAQTQSRESSPSEDKKRAWEADERDVTEFGGFALDDSIDVVACDTCAKPTLREAYAFHKENCAVVQAIAEGRTDASILKADAKSSDGAADLAADAAQRRKGAGAAGLGGKKNRGPINLDRQCGVINNKGLPCSRSLTCKSHSMGAKRNVPGRSQPYDTLLFEWQKATNPAFVARLEEKERQIAALKATSQANKEKKRKTAQEKRGAAAESGGAGADAGGGARTQHTANMYMAGATFQDVDRALCVSLEAVHSAATRERTHILPMATRSLAGQYTVRTKRCRVLRQFLAQGLAGTAHVRARMSEEERG